VVVRPHDGDTEYDTINLIFGAAISAYLGVMLASDELTTTHTWTLVLILAGLVPLILSVRDIYRSLQGRDYIGLKWPWNLTLALASGAGIQVLALTLPEGGEQFSIIFRGWMIVYVCILGATLIRERRKDE
jgi:small-conductance mechanosensitive channel